MPYVTTNQFVNSTFDQLGSVKLDGTWRIYYGYVKHINGKDTFTILFGGKYFTFTYPDYRIYNLNTTENDLYELMCSYNITEMEQRYTHKELAERATEVRKLREEELRRRNRIVQN